jgi:S1-C subfamily serine protease
MDWRAAPALVAVMMLSGCASKLAVYRYDNPDIRQRQAVQLQKVVPDPADQDRIVRHLGPRVGFLVQGKRGVDFDPATVSVPSGRAAAITADGYWLTALHVIENHPFYLVETTAKAAGGRGDRTIGRLDDRVITKVFPGRIVWQDRQLDLAVLKFERPSPSHLSFHHGPLTPGTRVHAADDSGRGVFMQHRGTSGMVGNGIFHAAGHVLSAGKRRRGRDGMIIESTMVSRGGMSGAPMVTDTGEMVGIIIQVEINSIIPHRSQTVAVMIPPERITRIIEDDRRASRAAAAAPSATPPAI